MHETYFTEQAHPDKRIGSGLSRQDYVKEVVRAFWYLMQGNEHLTPEEIQAQNVGPYQFDEAGELMRFLEAGN